MPEIGPTLREARMRARIDVSEIEAQTKIRAKYLRALENEEWGLLPGPTFVKSFLRTYAQALGLDGKALVEEYRLHHESPSDTALEPVVSSSRRSRAHAGGAGRAPGGPSRAYMALVGTVVALIILLIVALVSGGSSSKTGNTSRSSPAHRRARAHHAGAAGTHPASATVTLSLRPLTTVYVCLSGVGGRKLLPG